jgi:hypothetical protein
MAAKVLSDDLPEVTTKHEERLGHLPACSALLPEGKDPCINSAQAVNGIVE